MGVKLGSPARRDWPSASVVSLKWAGLGSFRIFGRIQNSLRQSSGQAGEEWPPLARVLSGGGLMGMACNSPCFRCNPPLPFDKLRTAKSRKWGLTTGCTPLACVLFYATHYTIEQAKSQRSKWEVKSCGIARSASLPSTEFGTGRAGSLARWFCRGKGLTWCLFRSSS